jgi:GH25 family lysozyme M1 (1,4-beta-N-acetylmuramidase)
MAAIVIDVSKHNGIIDWGKVKPHINGAIIRLGIGSDQLDQDDPQWERNVSECERLGISWGAYLYSYANTSAKIQSEIAHAKRLLSGHKPTLPIYYDLEERRYQGTWSQAAAEWCGAIREAGYIDGIYSWAWAINGMPDCSSSYWVAAYGINDGQKHEEKRPVLDGGRQLAAWQYTSHGYCDGITSSGLDVSEFYVDYTAAATVTPQPAAQQAAPSGSTLELAVAVMQGHYGSGATRKEKLGARYDEVQALLNHIASANANALAAEVRAGKYGSGDTRKVILGQKYAAVQAVINGTQSPRVNVEIQCLNRGRSGVKYGGGELCMFDDSIVGLSIAAEKGQIEYRVHCIGHGWYSKITKCGFGASDAYAGDLRRQIDGVQIYFRTDTSKTGGKYYRAKYQVKTARRGWLGEIYDTNWEAGDGNHTAGVFGDPIIGIRVTLVQV